MQRLKFFVILLYVLVLTAISFYVNGKSFIGIDDANIYLVYMRNFSLGYDFVYNIGGERVEGFTSILWTLIGSFFYFISDYPEILLLLLNIILITLSLYQITSLFDNKYDKLFSTKSLLFLGIVGATPGFIDWTVLSLLETGLWCTLLTFTVLEIIKYNQHSSKKIHYQKLSLLIILLVLCRPEAMLWGIFFIILNLIKEYAITNSIKTSLFNGLIVLIVFVSTLSLLVLWRLNYFGFPLPNTYYAKISHSIFDNILSGIKYDIIAFIEKPVLLFIGVFSAVLTIKKWKNKDYHIFNSLILFLIFGVTFSIPLYTGGDHFSLHRFIIAQIPILYFLTILIVDSAWLKNSTTILLILLVFFSNSYNLRDTFWSKSYPLEREWSIASTGRANSELLNNFFKEIKLPSQGVLTAGGSAYAYKGKTIDLLGLNNTKMAHAPKLNNNNLPKNHASFDKNTFYELKPDIFWYPNSEFIPVQIGKDSNIHFDLNSFGCKVFQNIHLDERFKYTYEFCLISKSESNVYLKVFAHNEFISKLDTNIYKIEIIKYDQ